MSADNGKTPAELNEDLLYPLTFEPAFKDYPWGGRKLETVLGRTIPDGIVAESWDIAAHPNGNSVVKDGSLAGKTLAEVMELLGTALVGSRSERALEMGRFPLLVKVLDANTWLSIQVHPDDAYGMAHEGEFGKTEMWVILHADPGAELIYGFQRGVTREVYARSIAEGRGADGLHRLPVKAGDVVFIPAGTIHALGPGIMVAEVQQNSDSTYRIYDWGRPRPVHIEKSLDVLNFDLVEPGPATPRLLLEDEGMRVEQLVSCPYFETERLTLPTDSAFFGNADGETFEIFGVLSGRVALLWEGRQLSLGAVEWVLLPAELGEFQVVAEEPSVVLRTFVP